MLMPNLEVLQLRVGTDSTPSPYFHPSLVFCSPVHLTALRLIQIDNKSILRSLGFALTSSTRLSELTIWADIDSMLRFADISSSWQKRVPFELKILDLRGFVDLGRPPWTLWSLLSPAKIRTLILYAGPHCDLAGYSEFWGASIAIGLRPEQLSTNLVVSGLSDFISAFSGLMLFNITSSNIDAKYPAESLPLLLDALRKQHSRTLKMLAIDPTESLAKHLLDDQSLIRLTDELRNIEEFRFGVENVSVKLPSPFLAIILLTIILIHQAIKSVLTLPRIRLLDVWIGDHATALDDNIALKYVLHELHQGLAQHLKYVMFGGVPLYKIVREPLRMLREVLPLEYIHDTSLLGEKVYDWVGRQ